MNNQENTNATLEMKISQEIENLPHNSQAFISGLSAIHVVSQSNFIDRSELPNAFNSNILKNSNVDINGIQLIEQKPVQMKTKSMQRIGEETIELKSEIDTHKVIVKYSHLEGYMYKFAENVIHMNGKVAVNDFSHTLKEASKVVTPKINITRKL